MDYLFFTYLNNFAGRWPILDVVGIFFASGAIWILLFTALFIWLINKRRRLLRRRWLAQTFLAMIIAYGLSAIIGLFYFRARPFVDYDVNQLLTLLATHKSLPSDHATIAFVLAISILFISRRLGVLALIIAGLIALGRVFVGVHYPLDVLVGAVLGSGVALLTHWLGYRQTMVISGRVARGQGRGRQLGFPTANLNLNPWRSPAEGVYAVWVTIGEDRLPGVTAVGLNGLQNEEQPRLVTHILGFNGDLYNQELEIAIIKKIRDDKLFNSIKEWGEAWKQDCQLVKQVLQEDMRRNH